MGLCGYDNKRVFTLISASTTILDLCFSVSYYIFFVFHVWSLRRTCIIVESKILSPLCLSIQPASWNLWWREEAGHAGVCKAGISGDNTCSKFRPQCLWSALGTASYAWDKQEGHFKICLSGLWDFVSWSWCCVL